MRHARTTLNLLTEKERQFATENHYMIEDFLRYHKLPKNEWYDVVVFRYLLAVQNWFRRPELHKYPFVSIVRRGLGSAVHNERALQSRRIKTASLDSPMPGTEDLRLIDTITEENLNFTAYVEGDDMNISYDVIVPERKRTGIGHKSDEVVALESFLTTKKMKNMRIEYDTPEEAKKKCISMQAYRRANKLQEAIEVFRDGMNVYVVRAKKEGK